MRFRPRLRGDYSNGCTVWWITCPQCPYRHPFVSWDTALYVANSHAYGHADHLRSRLRSDLGTAR